MSPLAAGEATPARVEIVELFTAAGAAGMLAFPATMAGRPVPGIIILQDGAEPDGRARPYTDQLLGAGFAVLEMVQLPADDLPAVIAALARDPRVAGHALGLLGFGAGGRQAAKQADSVTARALLYPGCEGMAPVALLGQAVLVMHGAADAANEARPCAALAGRLAEAGASVRLRVLPDASYAWDRRAYSVEGAMMLPRPDGEGRVRAVAWPALAEFTAAEVAGFFATSLPGHPR